MNKREAKQNNKSNKSAQNFQRDPSMLKDSYFFKNYEENKESFTQHHKIMKEYCIEIIDNSNRILKNEEVKIIDSEFQPHHVQKRQELLNCLKSEAIPNDEIIMEGSFKSNKRVGRGSQYKGVSKNGIDIW